MACCHPVDSRSKVGIDVRLRKHNSVPAVPKALGKFFRRQRVAAKLSQDQVAGIVGAFLTVKNREHNCTHQSGRFRQRIAAFLSFDPTDKTRPNSRQFVGSLSFDGLRIQRASECSGRKANEWVRPQLARSRGKQQRSAHLSEQVRSGFNPGRSHQCDSGSSTAQQFISSPQADSETKRIKAPQTAPEYPS